jgi:hypothetical protein
MPIMLILYRNYRAGGLSPFCAYLSARRMMCALKGVDFSVAS